MYGRVDLAKADERCIINIRHNEIGYVSQFLNVLPRVSALDSVINSLIEMDISYEEARFKAQDLLTKLKIEKNLWDAYPINFSGGEKMRLNLAQAIIKEPVLLLLDEPTASLDTTSKEYIRDILMVLKEKGTTMIGIFHDLEFMEGIITKKYEMKEGQFINSVVA